MTTLTTLSKNPIVHGAIGGFLAAAALDYQAFRSWKSFSDLKTYNWGLALFRWGQGAVIGAITSAGGSFL